MSRLGDLIRLERSRRGLSAKQVARKCGVSEGFLLDVESGKRIIADDQARRILRSMGLQQQTEADFTLDDIAATVDMQAASEEMSRAKSTLRRRTEADAAPVASAHSAAGGSIWLDALRDVVKRVPVMNAVMKEIGHRLMPVENGRVAGASPDKVFFFSAPDQDMRGFRICRGDLVLIVPAVSPEDGCVMLVEFPQGRALRMVKVLDSSKCLLQRFDTVCENEVVHLSDVHIAGKAVTLIASL